jgi:hypothetical protein
VEVDGSPRESGSARKPIPGVRGVWTPEVEADGSVERRQDRARTPRRRIVVPRAILG